jgi:molybdate transport system substrate-binding protein
MSARLIFVTLGLVASTITQTSMVRADEIKVFTAKAIATVLEQVGPDFQRATGHRLNVVSGFGPDFVGRINAGESFDVVVSAPALVDGLIRSGKLDANSRTNLVRAGTGVAVRAGMPKQLPMRSSQKLRFPTPISSLSWSPRESSNSGW